MCKKDYPDILESDVLVISRKGKVLGISGEDHIDQIRELLEDQIGNWQT